MMRTGIDASTGTPLTGWAHCAQSLGRCITTRFRSRVLARHLGSAVPLMQDQNADPRTIFDVYRSIFEAVNDPDGGEPGFSLDMIELVEHGRTGRFIFLLSGRYFPRGHLGDFSIVEARDFTYADGGLVN